MKVNNHDIGGTVLKDTDQYRLTDNNYLERLMLSQTVLKRDQQTNGHKHPGKEEIYFFVLGHGIIMLDEERIDVAAGDIILIPDGVFHKVINTGETNLIFNTVFEGVRNH